MQDKLLKLRTINDTEPTSMQARNNGGEGFGVMSGDRTRMLPETQRIQPPGSHC